MAGQLQIVITIINIAAINNYMKDVVMRLKKGFSTRYCYEKIRHPWRYAKQRVIHTRRDFKLERPEFLGGYWLKLLFLLISWPVEQEVRQSCFVFLVLLLHSPPVYVGVHTGI